MEISQEKKISEHIYHICRVDEWRQGRQDGTYQGSSQDLEDGFIHLSTAGQVRMSAEKHRAGQRDLVLLEVDPRPLEGTLRWEPSRRGELFPHVYGGLPISSVVTCYPLHLDDEGKHIFPARLAI